MPTLPEASITKGVVSLAWSSTRRAKLLAPVEVKVATVEALEVAEMVSELVAGERLPAILAQYPNVPEVGAVEVRFLLASV